MRATTTTVMNIRAHARTTSVAPACIQFSMKIALISWNMHEGWEGEEDIIACFCTVLDNALDNLDFSLSSPPLSILRSYLFSR